MLCMYQGIPCMHRGFKCFACTKGSSALHAPKVQRIPCVHQGIQCFACTEGSTTHSKRSSALHACKDPLRAWRDPVLCMHRGIPYMYRGIPYTSRRAGADACKTPATSHSGCSKGVKTHRLLGKKSLTLGARRCFGAHFTDGKTEARMQFPRKSFSRGAGELQDHRHRLAAGGVLRVPKPHPTPSAAR